MNEDDKCENCGCEIHPCMPCEEVVMLNGNHTDYAYLELLADILKNGRVKKNRTGVNTIGVFGRHAKFDVRVDAFPILTTKKVWFKGIVHELLWFIKGETNIKYLVDNDVHIWDEWAFSRYQKEKPKLGGIMLPDHLLLTNQEKRVLQNNPERDDPVDVVKASIAQKQRNFIEKIKENAEFAREWGELGKGTYGGMWRDFPVDDVSKTGSRHTLGVDQLKTVIEKLKTNPDDRRMIVSAWHPYWVDHCALPPCHVLFHFNTEELTWAERKEIGEELHPKTNLFGCSDDDFDGYQIPRRRLNLLLYQRSCDTFLGVPFNITSYSLLLALVAHCVGMVPGEFTHTYGDLHIYENHLDQVKLQLARSPKVLPRLVLNPKIKDLFDFEFDDIQLADYFPHPAIKGEIAV